MAISKVTYAGNTLIDLTGDTVTPENLLSGATAHAANGEEITGIVEDKKGELEAQIADLRSQIGSLNANLAKLYPVGSVYISVNDTDPGTFIGGTWERIKDRFLLAAGNTYAAGSTGGEATHTHKYGFQFGAYYGSISMEQDAQSGALQGGTGNPVGSVAITDIKSNVNNNAAQSTKTLPTSHYKSIADTSSASNIPPYLAVYMWKRTA